MLYFFYENKTDAPTNPIIFQGTAFNVTQSEFNLQSIVFDKISVNLGGDDSTTFTAQNENVLEIPRTGFYYFQVTSVSHDYVTTPVVLIHNSETVVMEIGPRTGKRVASLPMMTHHVVFHVTFGDKMELMVPARAMSGNENEQGSVTSPSDVTFTAFFVA